MATPDVPGIPGFYKPHDRPLLECMLEAPLAAQIQVMEELFRLWTRQANGEVPLAGSGFRGGIQEAGGAYHDPERDNTMGRALAASALDQATWAMSHDQLQFVIAAIASRNAYRDERGGAPGARSEARRRPRCLHPGRGGR